jgi:hypothetical protein
MRFLIKPMVVTAMLVCATPSVAFDMNFLVEAPVARLDAAQLKEFRAFLIKHLNESSDGTNAEWKATKTVFTSKLALLRSVTDGAFKCRQARIESRSQDRNASGEYWFCGTNESDWSIRIPSANAKPAPR